MLDMKRVTPATGEIYHIYNRGVEKRKVFLDIRDHLRFVHDLFEFNDKEPVINVERRFNPRDNKIETVKIQSSRENTPRDRKQMVEILAYCLMPNHYHLMMRQVIDNGITEFMRKIGSGYTNYFNLKYERVGPLFQGKYKLTYVSNDTHLLHLPHYIHLNPVGINFPDWEESGIKNPRDAVKYLENYKWSSFPDYCGKRYSNPLLNKEAISEVLPYADNPKNYHQEITDWLTAYSSNNIDLTQIAFPENPYIARSPTSFK
jgi:putative transposase